MDAFVPVSCFEFLGESLPSEKNHCWHLSWHQLLLRKGKEERAFERTVSRESLLTRTSIPMLFRGGLGGDDGIDDGKDP